jgi:hypothetical protein
MDKKFRVFATCDIGEAIDLLRQRGYEVEVYPHPEAPPKGLIVEKVQARGSVRGGQGQVESGGADCGGV